MDLYNEDEHVISSDEYSDDDDDDDALMNDAVRAQELKTSRARCNDYIDENKHTNWGINQKQKELSSLIRRNKIYVIYKNKSIKWLNNKRHRERYKDHIYLNTRKTQNIPIASENPQHDVNNKIIKKSVDNIYDTIHIEDGVSISDNTNKKEITQEQDILEVLEKVPQLNRYKCNMDVQLKNESENIDEKNMKEINIENTAEFKPVIKKTKDTSEKRARSTSPPKKSECNEGNISNIEKKLRIDSPKFYKSVNEMFPKFDKIATNHVETIANNNLTATEDKIKCLSNEIEALKEILYTKEMEWKRLLHLKMVKEEICTRLIQMKHILQLKENCANKQNSLIDLKELELYLSEKNNISSDTNHSSVTIQKLIEKRANMNAEDLKREKDNTSRLHSLLVSRNMLHGAESSDNTSNISNGEKCGIEATNKTAEVFNHLEGGNNFLNRGRQGEFRDVKSIIADFRQKNPELLPRVGKRIKSSESNVHYHSYSIPKFDKSVSLSQYFTKDHQSDLYPLGNSPEEISITPVGRVKKLSSSNDIDFVNTMNNYNVRLEGNYIKSQAKDFVDKTTKNIQYPLCQECKSNESRFVCAGCGNQWYCSKKCQISAWDKHSELCTE